MNHKEWTIHQMEQDGFVPRTDYEIELYATIGTKEYKKLSHVGFNMAVAEKETNTEPKHGSYQGDMMHGQSLAEKIAYEHCCRSEYNPSWLKGYLDEFSVDNCKEKILQRRAYQRLEETLRDNSYMADYNEWLEGEDDPPVSY